jgi:hypothetical protein
MISGCMIDGFGWFHEADYRRSWLLLDQVEYIMPPRIEGPLSFPSDLEARREFQVSRPVAPAEALITEAVSDCAKIEFLELVRKIPARDVEYAQLVVWSDADARGALASSGVVEPAGAVSYLLNKLLWRARKTTAAPLVGQPYASDLLIWKIAQTVSQLSDLPWKRRDIAHQYGYAACAAGLSLDFVADDELATSDIRRLAAFKASNKPLLERNQAAIMEAVRKFDGLPLTAAFPSELARLRQEAVNERLRLEELARDAWIETGLGIAKRAAAAAASGFGGGMLLLSAKQAPLTALAAAGGVIAAEALNALAKRATAEAPRMSFLFKVGNQLAREAGH